MMITLYVIAAALVGFIVYLLLGIFHQDAKNSKHFTYVPQDSFQFVVAGQKLVRVLSHLSGPYACEKETGWRVTDQSKNPNFKKSQSLLERLLGASYVSILYPIKRIHEFTVVADKLIPEAERSGKPIKDWVKTELRLVKYLLSRFPHPLYIADIELGGDKWKVNLLIMLDIQITQPATVVMIYQGKALEQVDAAVKSAVINYCNNEEWTYESFLRSHNGRGSKLEKIILDLNEDLAERSDGLDNRFGVCIKSAWVEDLELSGDQAELAKAAQVKALEEARAAGVIAAAQGRAKETIIGAEAKAKEIITLAEAQRKALEAEGAGHAQAYNDIVSAMTARGISPVDAHNVVNNFIVTGNFAKMDSLTTLIWNTGETKDKTPVIIQP
jgi:hypothetical protein